MVSSRLLLIVLLTTLLGYANIADARHHHYSKSVACVSTQGYTCLVVKRGQSWESLFPDDNERGIVMRINHTNQQIYSGKTILIPNNLASANILDFSPFARAIPAPQEKLIVVDLNKHAWAAYEPNGNLVRWGPASGGSSWCRDLGRPCRTKAGHFRIYSLGSVGCKSTKFPIPRGGAPMPYCMYFNGGQALHGSPGEVANGNISHGCVRLFVDDAEWIRFNFAERPTSENDYHGTRVIVLPY